MIVGHKNLAGKKVQITNDGVKVMDGNCMVSIRSNGISITDGSGSCSIDAGSITFRGLKNKHLFWENASPKSDFAAQTLSLPDIANYQVILIEFCDNVSGWWSNTQVPEPHIFVVGAGHAQRATFSWSTGHVRFVQVFENGNVQFWPGAVVAKNILTGIYEHSTDNSACIPYRIYGFL